MCDVGVVKNDGLSCHGNFDFNLYASKIIWPHTKCTTAITEVHTEAHSKLLGSG